jgi:steroid delta-isomerase-like uncharacterized protein
MEDLMRRLPRLAGILFAVVAAACAVQQKAPAASGKAIVEAYVHAWDKHDFAALDTILAPDAIHEDVAQNFRGQGPAAIKEFMRQNIAAEPDLNWQITNTIEDGRFVAFEWTWAGTYSGPDAAGKTVTRKKITAKGASFAEVENGKIKRFSDYYDLASSFR